jgi:hypothetical protein
MGDCHKDEADAMSIVIDAYNLAKGIAEKDLDPNSLDDFEMLQGAMGVLSIALDRAWRLIGGAE